MEKQIRIEMNDNKSVIIYVNGEQRLAIESNARKISAKVLYDLLDYHNGDCYTVEQSNPSAKDPNVLILFGELVKKITDNLNELSKNGLLDSEPT